MSTSDPVYSAAFAGPELLQQGRTNALVCKLYRDGALVAPSAGTCTIYRADGTTVETGSATIASSYASYTTTSTFSSETRGEGWRVSWALTVGGISSYFDRQAALCRRRLFPVVTDADLIQRHSDLSDLRPSGLASYQSYIDLAWEELVHDIRQKGSIPHLVLGPEDLKFVLVYRVLHAIYNDFDQGSPTWRQRAQDYAAKAAAAFEGLSFVYDTTDTATADTKRRAASPVTFLASGGDWNWPGYGSFSR